MSRIEPKAWGIMENGTWQFIESTEGDARAMADNIRDLPDYRGVVETVPLYTAEQIREMVEAVRSEWGWNQEVTHALGDLLAQLPESAT